MPARYLRAVRVLFSLQDGEPRVKALAILGAIVSAWVSGAASHRARSNGAVVLLFLAIFFGIIAWYL